MTSVEVLKTLSEVLINWVRIEMAWHCLTLSFLVWHLFPTKTVRLVFAAVYFMYSWYRVEKLYGAFFNRNMLDFDLCPVVLQAWLPFQAIYYEFPEIRQLVQLTQSELVRIFLPKTRDRGRIWSSNWSLEDSVKGDL